MADGGMNWMVAGEKMRVGGILENGWRECGMEGHWRVAGESAGLRDVKRWLE